LTGLKRSEVVGKTYNEILPGDDPMWVRTYGQVALTGKPVRFDNYSPALKRHYEVYAYRPAPMQFAVIFSDITERKQAHDQLEQRVQERTVELSQTVQQLQDEIARCTLAEKILRERTDLLRELASELTMAEQRQRQQMAELLHDGLQQLLAGAKFRLGILESAQEPEVRDTAVEVDALLSEAMETSRSLTADLSPPILHEGGLVAALEWLARRMQDKHGLAVDIRASDAVETTAQDVTILLFQAVRELLFNAVKHAKVKSARVEVSRQDGMVRLVVTDEGVGFDPAQLRAKGGRGGGFGLLSISERLDLLGGRMEVDSVPGRGSRFTLVAPLPAAPEQASPPRRAPKLPSGLAPPRGAPGPGPDGRIRVLIADDHTVMRQGLAGLLGLEGDMEIVGEAQDGESAIDLARKVRPDVVLMDTNMPGVNGIEATRIIHAELPEVRIIGLSMFGQEERAAAMRQAGAVNYLSKSGPCEAVIAAIRSCVGAARPKAPAPGDAQ
jgi:signal transduction histidine kinase/ActR/RegA family two-component response regulator